MSKIIIDREKRKLYLAKWYRENRDYALQKSKEYRVANAEKIKKRKAEGRDEIKKYNAKYYYENKGKFKYLNKKWLTAHREERKIYQENWHTNHPEARRAHENTRRARKLKSGGKHTTAEIKKLFETQGALCANPKCNASLVNGYHADHIMPLSRGGDNSIKNIQLLCPPCNQGKRAKHPVEWARELGIAL